MSDVVPGISWSPKPSCYHGDHCCLHSSHILQLFFQPSVFLKLLVFLLPDVAGCHLGLLHLSPLPSSDGSPPQLCRCGVLALTFSTFWDVSRFDPGASSLYTDVPVHYASHMVMVLHVRSACLYLTVRCYVLDGLSCTFAQPASGCGRRRPQTVCVVFRSSCSQPLVGFLDISHSL